MFQTNSIASDINLGAIVKQLKRIADALEEQNNMMKG